MSGLKTFLRRICISGIISQSCFNHKSAKCAGRARLYIYITYQKIYVKMMPVTTNLLFIHVVCTKGLVAGAKIVDTTLVFAQQVRTE